MGGVCCTLPKGSWVGYVAPYPRGHGWGMLHLTQGVMGGVCCTLPKGSWVGYDGYLFTHVKVQPSCLAGKDSFLTRREERTGEPQERPSEKNKDVRICT